MKIFCLDINEDRMVIELKKQGCQALYGARCFWIFTYVVWICILSFRGIGLVLKG